MKIFISSDALKLLPLLFSGSREVGREADDGGQAGEDPEASRDEEVRQEGSDRGSAEEGEGKEGDARSGQFEWL